MAIKTKQLAPPPESVMTPSWDLVKPSWQLALDNWELILYLFLLPALLYTLGSLLFGNITHLHSLRHLTPKQQRGVIILLVAAAWSLVNLAPSLYFRAKISARPNVELSLGECYRQGLKRFWRVWAVDILSALIIVIGLALLIVPGVIFLRRYYLANYYVVDQDMGIIAAMKQSSHDTKPVPGAIWGTLGVILVFTVAGGVVSSLPLIGVAIAAVVSYPVLFTPALRYHEIVAAVPAD